MEIEKEINQKVFESENQKLHVNILYTASCLSSASTETLKPFGMSWQQFNVLRILRGLHPGGATIKLLTERMIDKMSNASRLVEKLKQKGYVERQESKTDRRQVEVKITELGLDTLKEASSAMTLELIGFRDRLSDDEMKTLNLLLNRLRG